MDVYFGCQTTEMQVLLQSLQDDLQDQKQQNLDLVKLSEQKESEVSSLFCTKFILLL